MLAIDLLAFGFVNVAILGWLAAAAAPILIHLWMRHTHRDTPWAAMEFLREAIKRNARKLRVQQWLLLALRTLIILLIVVAAAKPFLSGWQLLGANPKVHRVLVLDASMSMQYELDGESRFARAQELAEELIDNAPQGGLYSVGVMGQPSSQVASRPTAEKDRARQAVRKLSVSSGSAHLSETLDLLEQHITQTTREHPDIERHEVIFFTDLMKHPWEEVVVDQSATRAESGVAKRLANLEDMSDIVAIDVGTATGANIALSQLAVAGALATTAEPVEVATLVTNYSSSPLDKVTVQLLVDGRAVHEQTTSLAPQQSATLTFEVPFHTAQWHAVSVRTAGDALAADDQAYLALNVPDRVRILCVEGAPRAARYVARALNPSGEPTSPLEPVVVGEGSLIELPLSDYHCIFACNVTRFTPAELTLLSNYVDRGGGLIVFLGDRVLVDAYNEAIVSQRRWLPWPGLLSLQQHDGGSTPQNQPLLPAQIGPLVTSETIGIDPLEYQHPIISAFRGRERAGLLTTPVTTYRTLAPHSGPGVQVAFATSTGDPLLVTHRFGDGVVALVATAGTLDTVDPNTGQPWTLLPAWPSFLPIIRELVAYASPTTRRQGYLQVGESVGGTLPSHWSQPDIVVARPDGRLDTVPVEREGAEVRWNYNSAELPGIYTARSTSSETPLAMEAVNVDTNESDLTRIDVDQLPPSIRLQRGYSARGAGSSLTASTPLHRWLLQSALGLLLVESVLAWWLGRANG